MWPNQRVPHGTLNLANAGWFKICFSSKGFNLETSGHANNPTKLANRSGYTMGLKNHMGKLRFVVMWAEF
jgi:hypothetical protein